MTTQNQSAVNLAALMQRLQLHCKVMMSMSEQTP